MKSLEEINKESEGKTSSKSSQLITFFLSLIALIISLYSLLASRAFTRDADIIGIAVALLCGLVTLLIGWNIYNIIDIKGLRDQINFYKKNAEIKSEETIEQSSQYLSTTLLSIADLMGTLFKDSANITTKPDLFYKAIKYRLLAAVVSQNNKTVQNAINGALNFLSEFKKNNQIVRIENDKVDDLLKIAEPISFKTNSYDELIDIIAKLKNWRYYYDEGNRLFKNHNNEEADNAFSIALELIPDGYDTEKALLYIYKGSAMKRLFIGNFVELEKAASYIVHGLNTIPSTPKSESQLAYGYSNLACIYAMLKKPDQFKSAKKEIDDLDDKSAREYGLDMLHRRLDTYAKDYLQYL